MDGLEAVVGFLRGIGLPVTEAAVRPGSFLPGIDVRAGALWVDPAQLLSAGDLLHEAGHLAVLAPAQRSGPVPDDPHLEAAAIAWSWAATCHLGLPLELLFHAQGYGGRSAALRLTCELGVVPGWHLLVQAGMAEPKPPGMRCWLRA